MKEVSSADLLCKRRHCIQCQHGEVRVLPKDEVDLGVWVETGGNTGLLGTGSLCQERAGLQWLDQDFPASEMLLDSSPKRAALPFMLHSTCISAVSSHICSTQVRPGPLSGGGW